MPGTPDPVLGSDPLTLIVAGALSALIVGSFAYAASKSEFSTVVLTAVARRKPTAFAVG